MLRRTVLLALTVVSVNANAIIVLDSYQDTDGRFHQTYCMSNDVTNPCTNRQPVEQPAPTVEAPKQIHLKRTDNKLPRILPENVDLKTNYRH
jgi:hypothetical protein